jgi:8-oxo-dGTP diphosphatase
MEGIIRTCVVFFCHDGNGNYLISKRSQNCRDEQGSWDGGGGGLKFGEKIEDAVRREIREEYCTVPTELEFMGYRDVFREQDGVQTHWVAFDFRVLVDPLAVKIGEPHKCDGLKWLTLEEIKNFREPVHSQFHTFLAKNNEKLI